MGSKRRSKQADPETPQADSKQALADFVAKLPDEGRQDLVEVLAVGVCEAFRP